MIQMITFYMKESVLPLSPSVLTIHINIFMDPKSRYRCQDNGGWREVPNLPCFMVLWFLLVILNQFADLLVW